MVRVLHCVAGLDRGGYETFIMNTYKKTDRTKVRFDFLYSFDGVYSRPARDLGSRLYKIPFITQKGPFVYRKALDDFFKEHPEYKIVHSHMDKFSGLVMERAARRGVPVRIAHSHNTQNEGGFVYNRVKNYYGRKIRPNCTHRFACSRRAGRWLFGDDDFKVIKNGIDAESFRVSDSRDPSVFTVGLAARFTRQKNHDFLIDVFSSLTHIIPRSRLLLAGSGALEEKIKDKVKSLGLADRVIFLGDVEDMPGFFSQCDVLCMPSLFEGLGIVAVEGQASGTPCVVSDKVPEEVNFTGDVEFLSLSETAGNWAKALAKYRGRSKKDNFEKTVLRGYDSRQTARELSRFYLSAEGGAF